MTQVEFLEIRGPRWQHALCDRVAQVFDTGQRVYLLADSEAGARYFDQLLWTFRDDSFVPHAPWQGESNVAEPVAVGWQEGNPNGAQCLVLARPEIPERLHGFAQVIDWVPMDLPELRADARARFRAFQARGLQPVFHRDSPDC